MTSYLATIRFEADDWDHAERKALDAVVATGGDRFEVVLAVPRRPVSVADPNWCNVDVSDVFGVERLCKLRPNHIGDHDIGDVGDHASPPVVSKELWGAVRQAVADEVASYFRPCLAEQDGKWCGKRNHHQSEHHFFLLSPDADQLQRMP